MLITKEKTGNINGANGKRLLIENINNKDRKKFFF